MLRNVISCDIRPVQNFDHNAVSLELKVGKGPGFWKLNAQILKDLEYQNCI